MGQFSIEENVFNEEDAVRFIRARIPKEINENTEDDEDILCIIDAIWDYYEKKGMLSLDNLDEEEELLDESDLIKYVKKELAENPEIKFTARTIEIIVKAELEYEESLEENI
ncbi:MAG: hypothetical protein NC201_00205 [Prevotella sp.]|nr:hypothetical protein [Bacteroides sp.]MCM1365650.1 hypothetical protein [Prevotella sp.]